MMFVIVDMSDNRKRIFEKFRQHEIELSRQDVKGCAPFFIAKCHRNYTDYDELKRIISRYGVALFSKEIVPKEQLASLQFVPAVLPLKMLVKTVSEGYALQKARCNRTVTVIDPNGGACDEVASLVRNVRYVRVVTSRSDRYSLAADKIFDFYGITIDVSDKISTSYGSDIIISLDDSAFDGIDCGRIICFRRKTSNKNVFVVNQCELKYDRFNSEDFGIDSFVFICALYETCGYHLHQIPVFKDTGGLNCLL